MVGLRRVALAAVSMSSELPRALPTVHADYESGIHTGVDGKTHDKNR